MRTTPREVCFESIKKGFKLSNLQRQVLIGKLLGDGALKFRGNDCRLHVKHSFNQLALVKYKRRIFRNITSMQTRMFIQEVKGKQYQFAEFVTLTHPEFTKYYNLFYPFSKKIIPKNISEFLDNPLSLTLWFMDDGSAEYAGASLQTHSFSKLGVDRLRKTIKNNFDLETTKRINKGRWIIYFPKKSLVKLKRLLEKYILAEFRYKLIPYSLRKQTP